MGELRRFYSIKKAISYCGLCGAEKSSGKPSSTRRCPNSATSICRQPTANCNCARITGYTEVGDRSDLSFRLSRRFGTCVGAYVDLLLGTT